MTYYEAAASMQTGIKFIFLPDFCAVTDGIVGIGNHLFVFFQSGNDFRRQSVSLTDLNHAPARLSLFFNKHSPVLSRPEKRAGGNLKNIFSFPDNKVRFQAVTIAENTATSPAVT